MVLIKVHDLVYFKILLVNERLMSIRGEKMSENILSRATVEPLIIGGAILGGGGGGSMERGRKMAHLAFDIGTPTLVDINELQDDELVVSVSSVGAPAAKDRFVQPIDYVTAIEQLQEFTKQEPAALITNENGGSATVNGLIQSAVLGIPVLDAPCNGRAHPTGVMGSMNLTELDDYVSVQSVVGGRPGTGSRIRQVVEGTVESSSKLVRQAVVEAGGLVAVARNMVPVSYLKNHAAIGAFTQAYEIGLLHQKGKTPIEKIENVLQKLSGKIIGRGKVQNLRLETIDGFDLGSFDVKTDTGSLELTFWNEYMTCEDGETRLSTFPELLMTFSAKDGMPVTSAELKEDEDIIITTAPYENLLLGGGMLNQSNYDIVETTLNKEIIRFINPLFSEHM